MWEMKNKENRVRINRALFNERDQAETSNLCPDKPLVELSSLLKEALGLSIIFGVKTGNFWT
jgi:hypothetical protein